MILRSKESAFTITEIIVVFLIIAAAATLGMVNYSKKIERSRHDNAWMNLIAIHSAAQMYHAQNGTYYIAAGEVDLEGINANLGLNIVDGDFNYSYTNDATVSFSATATRKPDRYQIHITSDAVTDTNPYCSGNCP